MISIGLQPSVDLRPAPRKTTQVRYEVFQVSSSWQHVQAAGPGWVPPVDLYETAAEIILEVDLAGVDPQQIQFHFAVDRLHITGQRPERAVSEATGYHILEIDRGTFVRTLELPAAVDPRSVQARSRDGLLIVRMRKLDGGFTKGCYSADSMEGFE